MRLSPLLGCLILSAACAPDAALSGAAPDGGLDEGSPFDEAQEEAPEGPDMRAPDATGQLVPPDEPGRFWHLENPPDSERTWLVGPEGTRTFVLGVNTVMRDTRKDGAPRCAGIRAFIRRGPPTTVAHREWARLSSGTSGGEVVEHPYGFTALGAWSETNDFDDEEGDSYMIRPVEDGGAGAPYPVVLSPAPRGEDRALRDEDGVALRTGFADALVGDPFHPAFLADLDAMAQTDVAPRRDDERLLAWYAGNETGMFDRAGHEAGVRDFRRWLWSACPAGSSLEAPACAPHALGAFLRERYATIDALDAAWQARYPSFAALVDEGPRPVPYEHDCNLACREDLQVFVHDRLLARWVREVTTRIRGADPNHLVASPRLAIGDPSSYRFFAPRSAAAPDVWTDSGDEVGTDRAGVRYRPFDLLGRDGDAGFDLVAVNVYTGDPTFARPWFPDGIHLLSREAGLPVIVSELGVRARLPGWSNRGGAGAFVPAGDGIDDQIQRGARYRSQIEQLVGFRAVVGAFWHAWSDRFMPGDESTQIDMGLVQCDDPAHGLSAGARWNELDDRVADTNARILDLVDAATGL